MGVAELDAGRPLAIVVGGTGYLGRQVCAALGEAGYDVMAVARRPAVPPPGARLCRTDLVRATPAELVALLDTLRPDVMVNAAGGLWGVTDQEMTEANENLVRALVDAVADAPGRPRLIHLGSTYEYGTQPPGVRLHEAIPEHPVTQYGRTKLAGTRIIVDAVAAGRLDGVVLRLSTVVGPGAPPGSLLGRVAYRLAARPPVLEIPALDGERDFIDGRDVADAVVAAARAGAVPPVLNIGSGRPVAVRGLVDRLVAISGVPVTVSCAAASTARRDGGIDVQHLDISAARQALGWSPRRDMSDALAALWCSASEIRAIR
jgi:nucleoside-diphosphate-sugar epimerase